MERTQNFPPKPESSKNQCRKKCDSETWRESGPAPIRPAANGASFRRPDPKLLPPTPTPTPTPAQQIQPFPDQTNLSKFQLLFPDQLQPYKLPQGIPQIHFPPNPKV